MSKVASTARSSAKARATFKKSNDLMFDAVIPSITPPKSILKKVSIDPMVDVPTQTIAVPPPTTTSTTTMGDSTTTTTTTTKKEKEKIIRPTKQAKDLRKEARSEVMKPMPFHEAPDNDPLLKPKPITPTTIKTPQPMKTGLSINKKVQQRAEKSIDETIKEINQANETGQEAIEVSPHIPKKYKLRVKKQNMVNKLEQQAEKERQESLAAKAKNAKEKSQNKNIFATFQQDLLNAMPFEPQRIDVGTKLSKKQMDKALEQDKMRFQSILTSPTFGVDSLRAHLLHTVQHDDKRQIRKDNKKEKKKK